MKKTLLVCASLVLTTGIFAQKKADEVARFKSETIDMGKVKQNSPKTVEFSVKNVGQTPLIIENANPTCGCTIGDFTKSPIAAGKSGKITATYNAANLGAFEKHLTVKFAGVDEIKNITIKGEVLTADDYVKAKLPEYAKPTTPTATIAPAPAATTKTVVKKNKVKTKTKPVK